MIEEPVDVKSLANSMVIFDDIDHVPSEYVKAVYKLRDTILEIGRHYHIWLCVTSHVFLGGKEKTSVLRRECSKLVVFPKSVCQSVCCSSCV